MTYRHIRPVSYAGHPTVGARSTPFGSGDTFLTGTPTSSPGMGHIFFSPGLPEEVADLIRL
jgi:hypothetical protein